MGMDEIKEGFGIGLSEVDGLVAGIAEGIEQAVGGDTKGFRGQGGECGLNGVAKVWGSHEFLRRCVVMVRDDEPGDQFEIVGR